MKSAPIFSSLHSINPCTINHPSSTRKSLITASRPISRPCVVSTKRPPTVPVSRNKRSSSSAVNDISAITAQPEITWQIVAGALAGVAPFVVAGIEFSKRIVAQRNCKVCKGSGLVLRDNKYYFRCPACGGFLPWQSWTRFFTG